MPNANASESPEPTENIFKNWEIATISREEGFLSLLLVTDGCGLWYGRADSVLLNRPVPNDLFDSRLALALSRVLNANAA